MNNPWAGLASYQDPAAGSTLLFCGRDNESYDLAALVDDNIFCTLYGKSGTGKTSLLNAGVFPRLREMGYLPVSIRLGMEAMGTTFQQCVVSRLAQVAGLQAADTVALPADDQDEQWLWAWFARTRFVNGEGKTRFAVLVFDQFEEVFRSRRDEAEALLRQIHFMMDPSHSLGESYDYNFRFLASIREDDLYLLEDSLDRNFMGDMKQCRYRLNALSDEGARDVILKPGQGLFVEGEQDEIVNTIIGIARSADGSINTNILSLVCSRIYEEYRRNGAKSISLELVRGFVSSNPFEQFYNEVTRDLGEREKRFIEDRLVDAAGRRGSVSEPDFEKNVPNGAHLLEGTGRILQRVASGTEGRSYRIELIHDSFCAPLADQKMKRAARRRRRITIAVSVVALIIAAVAAWIVIMSIRNARQTREILIQQERFYAKQASQLLDEGDTYTALLLLNELTDPDGPFAKVPFQPEAERQMRRAIQMNDTAEWQVECTYQIDRGRFCTLPKVSADGKYLVESTVGNLLIYDFQTGRLIKKIKTETSLTTQHPVFQISHNSKTIAYYDCDEYGYDSPIRINCVDVGSGNKLLEKYIMRYHIGDDGEEWCNRFLLRNSDWMFSNDDKKLFCIIDSIISWNPYNNQNKIRVFSLIDSIEYILEDEDDVWAIETGNVDGANIAARKNDGEILIYDKQTFKLVNNFIDKDDDIWKLIRDDVMLFVKKDGLYKYTIPKKKIEKISDKYYDCTRLQDVQMSTTQICLSIRDTVFILNRNSLSMEDTFIIDTTKYSYATLCDSGRLLLLKNDLKKLVLVTHNSPKTQQKVAPSGRFEFYIAEGRLHISTTEGLENNISVFQIRNVDNNMILFSDTTDVQRDIESISPSERYLITDEWAVYGDTLEDLDGSIINYNIFKLFDIEQMKWIYTFDTSDFKRDVYFTNKDNLIIYPRKYKNTYCYDIETSDNRPFFTDSLSDSICIYGMSVNSNSNSLFAVRTSDADTRILDSKTHRMRVVSNEEYKLMFTPNGKYIVSLAKDNTLRLHNSSDFKAIDSCNSNVWKIKAVNPAGTMCVVSTVQSKLELWSLFPLRKIGDLGMEYYLEYGWDGVYGWNPVTMSFCDDGKNIVFYSADPDGFFKIPILSQQEVIEKARAATNGRKLTEEEKSLLLE